MDITKTGKRFGMALLLGLGLALTGCDLLGGDDDPTVEIKDFGLSRSSVDVSDGSEAVIDLEGTVDATDDVSGVDVTVTDENGDAVDSDVITVTKGGHTGNDPALDIILTVQPTATTGTYNVAVEVTAGDVSTTRNADFDVAGPTATALDAAADFTFKREGGADGTGLVKFGLAWTSNSTAGNAVIKKDADKLVKLTVADWTDITTKEALMAAVDAADDMDKYEGVKSTQGGTYDDVIATQKGTTYYILHITNSTVKTETIGTVITITGKYKM